MPDVVRRRRYYGYVPITLRIIEQALFPPPGGWKSMEEPLKPLHVHILDAIVHVAMNGIRCMDVRVRLRMRVSHAHTHTGIEAAGLKHCVCSRTAFPVTVATFLRRSKTSYIANLCFAATSVPQEPPTQRGWCRYLRVTLGFTALLSPGTS